MVAKALSEDRRACPGNLAGGQGSAHLYLPHDLRIRLRHFAMFYGTAAVVRGYLILRSGYRRGGSSDRLKTISTRIVTFTLRFAFLIPFEFRA